MAEGKATAANIAKAAKLIELAKDLLAKQHDIMLEVDELLGGRAGIGEQMKDLERAFDAAWCARYAPGQFGRYVWAYAKDRPQMKRLLRTLAIDELKLRILHYIKDDDHFYVKARHPFGLFVSSINRHTAESEPPAFALSSDARPVACVHVPACKSDQEHTRRRNEEMRAIEE
jgi:hypothetical protein